MGRGSFVKGYSKGAFLGRREDHKSKAGRRPTPLSMARASALTVMLVLPAACASGGGTPEIFTADFWSRSPAVQPSENDLAELGIAELAKGNFIAAEEKFEIALEKNPKDVDALLGSAILYQNTGQATRARERYEAVLALKPEESQQFINWTALTPQPAAQVARSNLSTLLGGSQGAQPTQAQFVPQAQGQPIQAASQTAPLLVGRAPSAPAGSGLLPVSAQPGALTPLPDSAVVEGALNVFSPGEQNTVSRFTTLKALRDQSLITPGEFGVRRRANIGALLPLTAPRPSAGLDQSVPSTEQISNRLRAIARALELRAITPGQQKAERDLILDALMPAAPSRLALPAAPPKDLLEGADQIRKLDRLLTAGLITQKEYDKESKAIELAIQPKGGQVATAPKDKKAPKKAVAKKSGGEKPGVHLASYRSEKKAREGWKALQKRHGSLLKDLSPDVAKVTLGKKGTFYRLRAGPLASQGAAKKLCTDLKRRRQYCDVTTVSG